MNFRLLRPEEVILHWDTLATILEHAVEQGRGELEVGDIRKLVLGGRMFLFAGFDGDIPIFAVTAEFCTYPQKSVLLIGFGAGVANSFLDQIWSALSDFARRGGASTLQTYVKNPAMVRYHRRFFEAEPAYTVLEKLV